MQIPTDLRRAIAQELGGCGAKSGRRAGGQSRAGADPGLRSIVSGSARLRLLAQLATAAGRSVLAAALLLGLARAVSAQGEADVAAGKMLAEQHCSRCHAVGDEGQSLMEGAPPLRDLKLRYPIEDLAEAMAEGMVTAHPQMPVFTFSPEEIDDLLAYLDSLE
jgi:mono/diheme cytochrome c family protein